MSAVWSRSNGKPLEPWSHPLGRLLVALWLGSSSGPGASPAWSLEPELWVGACSCLGATAGSKAAPAQEESAARMRLDQAHPVCLVRPGLYTIGQVTLDQTNRTARFPAVVNQRAGLVEYALVTTQGKVHESVFRTETEPRDIHLAMLLLGVEPSGTNRLAEDPESPLPGERIDIEVWWRHRRREMRRPLAECVGFSVPARDNRSRDWLYNGSFVHDGALAAQSGGSLIALITDASALINNPRPDRADDEIHHVKPRSLPPEETPVEIVLKRQPHSQIMSATGSEAAGGVQRAAGAGDSTR